MGLMALFKALVWALIFLTKLRFPPGVSIAIVHAVLLTTLNNVGRTTLFNPVFNNLQQLVIFTCVRFPLIFATKSSYVFYSKAAILYFCLSKLLCTKATRVSRVFIELYRNTSFARYYMYTFFYLLLLLLRRYYSGYRLTINAGLCSCAQAFI